MSITITPIEGATLGAVITSVELGALDDDAWSEIHGAFLDYGVLVFPDQHLDAESQGRFALRFGATERMSPKHDTQSFAISNRKADGSLAAEGEEQYKILRGNEGWHTDSTYMPLASKAAMLTAVTLPPVGGETEFADMRAAWDALDGETQAQLEGLSAYHSLYYSQAKAGFSHSTDNVYGFHDKGAPLRPIVKVHPETGRKSLYTGRHAYGIPGMSAEASETLLAKLLADACQPPRVYTHYWQVGDTVVWDNRCLLHRARPYDPKHERVLLAARISGEAESELAPTFADERAVGFKPSASNVSSLAG